MEIIGGFFDSVEHITKNKFIKENDDAKDVKNDFKQKKLRNACAEFESFFIQEVLKSARKSIPENGFFEKKLESDTYKAMMDQELARCMAKGKGLGLGEMLYEQLLTDKN